MKNCDVAFRTATNMYYATHRTPRQGAACLAWGKPSHSALYENSMLAGGCVAHEKCADLLLSLLETFLRLLQWR